MGASRGGVLPDSRAAAIWALILLRISWVLDIFGSCQVWVGHTCQGAETISYPAVTEALGSNSEDSFTTSKPTKPKVSTAYHTTPTKPSNRPSV